MKFGVVVFPGSNCDEDCFYVLKEVLRQNVVYLWHKDACLKDCDCVVLPGGFSYGDYLRAGAIARFSPIMRSVSEFSKDGGLVLGICNGFQILLESGLLSGAMLRNTSIKFICRYVTLRVERTDTPFTNRFRTGQVVRMPIAHNEGNYTTGTNELRQLKLQNGVLFRYCDADGQLTPQANPNGSTEHIAGICNRPGNVMGLMPHPERSAEPELGSMDGRLVFESLIHAMAAV